nr:uncharacterized protein LOC104105683 [Nicotiana tomentosiformis]
MAENDGRPVIEATRPSLANITRAIVKHGITKNFELKQHVVQLIQSTGTDLRNLERQFEKVASNQNVKPARVFPIKEAEKKDDKQRQEINARLPPPFPQRLQKQKDEAKYRKFIDILSHVHVNLPLVEVLQEVPKYAKYLRDIVANMRRNAKFERVALTECSARVQSKLPPKLKDLRYFTIPLANEKHDIGRALCDLGASVNLMPLSIFKQLELGVPRPTTITLQLADRSLAVLEGIIEYVLVRVGKSIFPANFIIFDYMADEEVPVILGVPFLATGGETIYVREGKMKMRVHDEEVTFNVYKALKLPKHYEDL